MRGCNIFVPYFFPDPFPGFPFPNPFLGFPFPGLPFPDPFPGFPFFWVSIYFFPDPFHRLWVFVSVLLCTYVQPQQVIGEAHHLIAIVRDFWFQLRAKPSLLFSNHRKITVLPYCSHGKHRSTAVMTILAWCLHQDFFCVNAELVCLNRELGGQVDPHSSGRHSCRGPGGFPQEQLG